MSEHFEYDNDPNIICLNDAVLLHSNRKGIVRYISDKTQNRIAVGIELTEPNPSQPADVSKLFKCKPNHGILIPLTQIARKIMPQELLNQLQFLTDKMHKYHAQVEHLRKKIVENENQTCSFITNQFLSTHNTQHTRPRRNRHHKDSDRQREYVAHHNKKQKRNTHDMTHSLCMMNGLHGMITQYKTKDKVLSPMKRQSPSKSTNGSHAKHHKHVQIKDDHRHPQLTNVVISTDLDETFSNPSVETVHSHMGHVDGINSNESSNHIT
eukprot:207005_1